MCGLDGLDVWMDVWDGYGWIAWMDVWMDICKINGWFDFYCLFYFLIMR